MITGKCEAQSFNRKNKRSDCTQNAEYRVVFSDETEKLVCKSHAIAYRNRVGQPNLAGQTVLRVVSW